MQPIMEGIPIEVVMIGYSSILRPDGLGLSRDGHACVTPPGLCYVVLYGRLPRWDQPLVAVSAQNIL
jgi:hypothetical protein